MKSLARVLALLSFSVELAARLKIKSAALDPSLFVYGVKMLGAACAPEMGLAGAAAAAWGAAAGDAPSVLLGSLAALLAAGLVSDVTAPHDGFERAFGADWTKRLANCARDPRRWTWLMPAAPRPRVRQNVAFWSLPAALTPHGSARGGTRDLLCDLWEPPQGAPRSGLALIYLHAGGWQSYDKDTGTRPFFSYLTAQGHTIMDVAYRMCGETNMAGMLGDVKRAVAWLKVNAEPLGVDPGRVVLAGASAGAQLALLAAFTPNHPVLDPEDVRAMDTSVRGAISYYGPVDVLAYGDGPVYPDWPVFVRIGRRLGMVPRGDYLEWPDVERRLFGARAREAPETAKLFSPIAHAGPGCPPVLLIHGAHDRVVPPAHSRRLCAALRDHGVPAVYVEVPLVDHAFDLPFLRVSPPAQATLHDVERFLHLMTNPS